MLITVTLLFSLETVKMIPFDQFFLAGVVFSQVSPGIEQQVADYSAGVRLQYNSRAQKYFSIIFWSSIIPKMYTLP